MPPDQRISDNALLSGPEAAAYCGVSRATWFRTKARGDLPAPVVIPGGRRERWRRADLDRWLAALRGRRRTAKQTRDEPEVGPLGRPAKPHELN